MWATTDRHLQNVNGLSKKERCRNAGKVFFEAGGGFKNLKVDKTIYKRYGRAYALPILFKRGNMEIKNIKTEDIIPYENNPRHNEEAVEGVMNSIKEFGFKVPIVIDKNNIVVTGHTRLKAAKKLGMETVPTIVADDLSEEQIKAFRIADNKVAEFATWDIEKLEQELSEIINIQMGLFGIEQVEEKFEEDNRYTMKVSTPVYEPTGAEVKISDLVDNTKTEALKRKIYEARLPEDIEEFLINAAQRHLKFNYKSIAEYYANAEKEVQELFEQSALVIIDYNKAIEYGYVKLSEAIDEMMEDDE